jgi:hypothetical protein
MKGRGTAKRDHGVFGKVFAIFHRVHPRGIGHVLIDHLGHAESGLGGVEIKHCANMGLQRAADASG